MEALRTINALAGRPFMKMNGLGNDFVVLDSRADGFRPSAEQARALADRTAGIGCDQVITLLPSDRADVFMHVRNADGGAVGACGNAARCIAGLLLQETGKETVTIETASEVLAARAAGSGTVSVYMGTPRTEWRDIPLAHEADTLHLPLSRGPLSDGVAVNVGNPHAVFFVEEAGAVDLASLGPELETDPLFPERANINVAQILGKGQIRLRVWERGAGLTQACGTGACATLVAAVLRGLCGRRAAITLDGGPLTVEWREDGDLIMTGDWTLDYRDRISGGGDE